MNKSNQQINQTAGQQVQPRHPITARLRIRGPILLLIALTILAATNPARGALLAYEGFDYPDGSDITGQNGGFGWTNAWDSLAMFPSITVAGSLTYTDKSGNKLITTGNKLRNSGDASDNNTSQPSRTMAHYFTATETNQTTWLTCLAQRFGTRDVDPNGGPDFYGRGANITTADTLQDPTQLTYRFCYGTHSGEKLDVWEIDSLTPALEIQSTNSIAEVSLLAFRVDHRTNTVDSPPNDVVFMWVNPPLGSEPSTNTAAAIIGDTELSFNHFEFFAGGNNGTYLQAEWYVDEIRVGTTYADVAPFTPGGGAPTVAITRDAVGVPQITYTGTLVSATAVNGPYQPVPGAVSPYKPNVGQGATQFYRTKN